MVVTTGDESASALTVAAAGELAPGLTIIARAATREGVKHLSQLGAQTVIHPELEGGQEIVRHLLLQPGYPLREVSQYADALRREHYDLQVNPEEEHRLLRKLLDAADSIEITWLRISPESPLAGQTLAEANVRARTGALAVAILRDGQLMANPKSIMVIQPGDRLGLIGDQSQVEAAERLAAMAEPYARWPACDLINQPSRLAVTSMRKQSSFSGFPGERQESNILSAEKELVGEARSFTIRTISYNTVTTPSTEN